MINILHEILMSIINSIAIDTNKTGAVIIALVLIVLLITALILTF